MRRQVWSTPHFTITAEFTRAHWLILLSICRQTHEFEVHATRQRGERAIRPFVIVKKQIDVSF